MSSRKSSADSMAAEAKQMIHEFAKYQVNTPYVEKVVREEVWASQTMKTLTARYGTRGKSAKSVFLQGFRDEIKGRGKKTFKKILQSQDPDEIHCLTANSQGQKSSATSRSSDSSKIITRPAAMVLYSKFCSRLEMLAKTQIFHLGLVPPSSETSWLYDPARQDSFKTHGEGETSIADGAFEIIGAEELLEETEEKMLHRLKIYKRAMSALILHCEALRPLLREIKRSYDSVLKLRDRQLLETSWVSQNICTAERELQERTQRVGFEGQSIIKLIENQCRQLMRHIDKQDAAIRIMTEILNALENALGEEHELRRDSDDQNKMFIKDINDLRKKLGMPARLEEMGETVTIEEVHSEIVENIDFNYTPDDPLILRKALDICRHDLHMAQVRMDELEEEHKDEVPRHLFEEMKHDLEDLEENHVKLKEKTEETMSQVQGIKDQIEKLTTERDTLRSTAGELRVKITPRPSWEKVGEFVEGGVPKWKQTYEGKTSLEISNKVIEELNAKKTASPPEYLSAWGDDPEVPRCLRHDTRVRDKRLTRRDAEVIINDIWKSRIEQLENIGKMREEASTTTIPAATAVQPLSFDDEFDAVNDGVPTIIDFAEYVAQYFEERFPSLKIRMEWTYNLVDACKRLTMNQKLAQFLGVLMGKIEEGCYHMLRAELDRFHRLLRNRTNELGTPEGQMTLGEFRALIEMAYPFKNEAEVRSLIRVTSKQTKAHAEWTLLNYEQLFAQTDEGFEGEFVDEFAKQLDEDRIKYIHSIIQGLMMDLGVHYDYDREEESPMGETDVHMVQFYKALVAVDPQIKEETVAAALSWVYVRTSVLPGSGSRGLLLVEYIKARLHTPEGPPNESDEMEYDRAIEEIRAGYSKHEDEEKHRGAHKKDPSSLIPKAIKLRVLIRRFREAAILHSGLKISSPVGGKRYPGEIGGEYYDDYMEYGDEEEEDLFEEMEDEAPPSTATTAV